MPPQVVQYLGSTSVAGYAIGEDPPPGLGDIFAQSLGAKQDGSDESLRQALLALVAAQDADKRIDKGELDLVFKGKDGKLYSLLHPDEELRP